jgi:predicted kinase
MNTLFLMLGYPGAGKTTTARAIHKLTGAVHLMSDEIRLQMFANPQFTPEEHQALYSHIDKTAEALLKAGKDVIYDANLNRHVHRQQKYEICRRTSSKPVLVWVRTQRELAKERATLQRVHDTLHPYNNLSVETFERLAREIEPPTQNEPYVEIDGTKVTEDYVKNAFAQAGVELSGEKT